MIHAFLIRKQYNSRFCIILTFNQISTGMVCYEVILGKGYISVTLSLYAQAYTSQILSLTMFALVMSEDRISLQPRRSEIIQGLKQLPELIRRDQYVL
jgi:hypothetical protein